MRRGAGLQQGPQGPAGPTGATGLTGLTGATGAQGPAGVVETDSTTINCGTSATLSAADIETYGTIRLNVTAALLTLTIPTIAITAGRSRTIWVRNVGLFAATISFSGASVSLATALLGAARAFHWDGTSWASHL